MIVQVLLSAIEHELLQFEVSQVLSPLFPRQCILRLLFLSDLGLYDLELFLSVLLGNLLFNHSAAGVSFRVLFKSMDSFALCLVLHDFVLLLDHVRYRHVLKSHMPTC